ncbi:hypothetical protein, partial [Actinomadura roseirufa]|uniref:hypothetical protein n=1 Tax=Actinomadura roseirufa TaxID=2094049 RepID=UPI0013F161CD
AQTDAASQIAAVAVLVPGVLEDGAGRRVVRPQSPRRTPAVPSIGRAEDAGLLAGLCRRGTWGPDGERTLRDIGAVPMGAGRWVAIVDNGSGAMRRQLITRRGWRVVCRSHGADQRLQEWVGAEYEREHGEGFSLAGLVPARVVSLAVDYADGTRLRLDRREKGGRRLPSVLRPSPRGELLLFATPPLRPRSPDVAAAGAYTLLDGNGGVVARGRFRR